MCWFVCLLIDALLGFGNSFILAVTIIFLIFIKKIFFDKEAMAMDFINVIGNRLIAESGDSKSKKFLFERISLVIQRGNAASIRGTFPDSAILLEIFVL
jgi:hypothetical protein